MNGDGDTCVYCGTPVECGTGQGDHVIPAALGEFENDVRFRRICRPCNSDIGKCEQQMLQCGPEKFFRDIVRPRSRRLRNRGHGMVKRSMGAPGPEFTAVVDDHTVLVKPLDHDPRDVEPLDQLVIRKSDGTDRHIRLFPGMRPEQLKMALTGAGVVKTDPVWLHCDHQHWERYSELMRTVQPNAVMKELSATEPGMHQVEGKTKFTVTTHYFRAIAKIAFHYYLTHSQRGYRGDEQTFAGIKRFIMEGGDRKDFFHDSGKKFVLPVGPLPTGGVVTPHCWCHLLGAHEIEDAIVIYVHLFLGPGCIPSPYRVTLGKLDTKVILPTGIWGHVYLYDPGAGLARAGRVEKVSVLRFRPK